MIIINKKFFIITALLLLLAVLLILFISKTQFRNTMDVELHHVVPSYQPDTSYRPPQQSREELYQDIFVSLLLPYIQNEVEQYYVKYLTEAPVVYPYDVHVLSAERPNGYRTFLFRLKLQTYAYLREGPHIPVGLDNFTVLIEYSDHVTMEKFEHIESFELPPGYEDAIRKGYHNPIP